MCNTRIGEDAHAQSLNNEKIFRTFAVGLDRLELLTDYLPSAEFLQQTGGDWYEADAAWKLWTEDQEVRNKGGGEHYANMRAVTRYSVANNEQTFRVLMEALQREKKIWQRPVYEEDVNPAEPSRADQARIAYLTQRERQIKERHGYSENFTFIVFCAPRLGDMKSAYDAATGARLNNYEESGVWQVERGTPKTKIVFNPSKMGSGEAVFRELQFVFGERVFVEMCNQLSMPLADFSVSRVDYAVDTDMPLTIANRCTRFDVDIRQRRRYSEGVYPADESFPVEGGPAITIAEILRSGPTVVIEGGTRLQTLNFGARGSGFFGRVYDKIAERKSRGQDGTQYGPVWTRFETEVKKSGLLRLGIENFRDLVNNPVYPDLWSFTDLVFDSGENLERMGFDAMINQRGLDGAIRWLKRTNRKKYLRWVDEGLFRPFRFPADWGRLFAEHLDNFWSRA